VELSYPAGLGEADPVRPRVHGAALNRHLRPSCALLPALRWRHGGVLKLSAQLVVPREQRQILLETEAVI
jgi:hypothetical protein